MISIRSQDVEQLGEKNRSPGLVAEKIRGSQMYIKQDLQSHLAPFNA